MDKRQYMREYREGWSPEYKEGRRLYMKEYSKEYRQKPEVKERLNAQQRARYRDPVKGPQLMEYQRLRARRLSQTEKVLNYRKQYKSRPDVRERDRMLQYRRLDGYKESAINMYSNGEACCAICKNADIDVLCLDHIEDNGKEHRAKLRVEHNGWDPPIYLYLRMEGYPPGFQVLCFNCNMKKEITRRRKLRRM